MHCLSTDNWVAYTVRYVVDYRRRRATKDRLSQQVLVQLEATNGRVQLGSATFEVVGVPPLRVDLAPHRGGAAVLATGYGSRTAV